MENDLEEIKSTTEEVICNTLQPRIVVIRFPLRVYIAIDLNLRDYRTKFSVVHAQIDFTVEFLLFIYSRKQCI
jgi:hypothetical protein